MENVINLDVGRLKKSQLNKIDKIVERAERIQELKKFPKFSRLMAYMDIAVVHINGNPIDFDMMLNCSNSTFIHDFYGIRRHLNRQTGRLDNFFLPRCTLSAMAGYNG